MSPLEQYFADNPGTEDEYNAMTEYEQYQFYASNVARQAQVQFTEGGGDLDTPTAGLVTDRATIRHMLEASIEAVFVENWTNVTWYENPPDETEYTWNDEEYLLNSQFARSTDSTWGPAGKVIEDALAAVEGSDAMTAWDEDKLNELMGPPNSIGTYAEDIYKQFQAKYNEIAADKVPSYAGDETDGVKNVEGEFERDLEKDARGDQYQAAQNQLAQRTAAQQAASQQVKTIDFKEQCFLLAKIFDLIDIRRIQIEPNEPPRPLPYVTEGAPNASLLVEGEPYGMFNRLTTYPSTASLFNLSTAEISQLQPRIELYKVGVNGAGDEVSQPILFDGATTSDQLQTLIKTKGKRGVGVGIKDFTFSYEGNNPFSVKKSIQASLTLFANSLDDILRERDGYRYIDLALKTGGEKVREALKEEQLATDPPAGGDVAKSTAAATKAKSLSSVADQQMENLSYLNYRIKAVVGWQKPITTGVSAGELQTAVNDSFITLNLTPTIHEFDFDETGRISLKIQYFAYVEESFDEKMFNIFSSTEVFKNSMARSLSYRSLDAACQSKAIAKLNKKNREQAEKDKEKALQSIFNMLSKKSKIRYMSIPHSELKSFNKEGPYYNLSNLSKMKVETLKGTQASKTAKNITEDIQQNASKEGDEKKTIEFVNTKVANANSAQLVFFYLSDLIDVIMEGIDNNLKNAPHALAEVRETHKDAINPNLVLEEQLSVEKAYRNWQKYRIMLGTVEIVKGADPESISFANIGDIPI